MNEEILEPVKSYFALYRDRHKQLAEEYFDELVRASGVSAEENAALMADRNKLLNKLNAADKDVKKHNGLKTFFIILTVVLLLAAIFTPVALWNGELRWVGILVAALGVAGAAALIAVICVVLNKRIRSGNKRVDELRRQISDIEQQAWKQMQPLNAKYDWNMPDALIYQTVPQIRLDKYFDENKLNYFAQRCSLDAFGENSSAVCVRSGNSDGKPFMLTRFLRQDIEAHTYTGSLYVTWTETEYDSHGAHTVHRSETLFATVVKPMPVYNYVTYLFYGCDAASDLHFSRKPTVPRNADDKKIASFVKKGEKELEKKARQAVGNGGSYNKLANSEFEVLFGADNRDNEVQFRMMYTPLAQQNTVELLRTNEPYGDDFYFQKIGFVNVVQSAHAANTDIEANPQRFVNFDLQEARKNFVEFNCDYFKSLYFDFAPLFCVPLYTQHSQDEPFDVCTEMGNIGDWEAEAVANHFDSGYFAHPSSATKLILKAQTEVGADSTTAHITAHSFEAIPQVEYVPTLCRNGNIYPVPVPWVLYVPLEQQTDVTMQARDVTREEFNSSNSDAMFVAGIVARVNKNDN